MNDKKEVSSKIRKKRAATQKSAAKKKSAADKKAEQLKAALAQREEECIAVKDQLLRLAAEMDNYRKRSERERNEFVLNANAGLIRDILPIIDDFERSLKSSGKKESDPEFRKGIELIFQKMLDYLKKRGLEEMHAQGETFDVDLHDALLQQEKKGVKPGLVLEEHEKGYLFNGRVLRHAKVIVSK